jgi:hypothetical protein
MSSGMELRSYSVVPMDIWPMQTDMAAIGVPFILSAVANECRATEWEQELFSD